MIRSWDWFGDGRLVVTDVPLACCALEVEAALPMGRSPFEGEPTGSAVHVVTVTGTVSNHLAHEVAELVRGLERAPWVVAVGACASGGGPYWDSYSVLNGIDQLLAVDRFVPGCPPTPDAISAVLRELLALGPKSAMAA